MSDGINLKARIHNTVLSLNDTPLFHERNHYHHLVWQTRRLKINLE